MRRAETVGAADGGETVIFEVKGKPQGKARARTFYDERIGKMRSVTPEGTRSYEELIRWSFVAAGGKYGGANVPFTVSIVARYSVPQAWSKSKREKALNGEICPQTKPDCDNIVKSVLDALNGVAYADDKQVVAVSCRKKYAAEPCVMVKIEEEENETRN